MLEIFWILKSPEKFEAQLQVVPACRRTIRLRHHFKSRVIIMLKERRLGYLMQKDACTSLVTKQDLGALHSPVWGPPALTSCLRHFWNKRSLRAFPWSPKQWVMKVLISPLWDLNIYCSKQLPRVTPPSTDKLPREELQELYPRWKQVK